MLGERNFPMSQLRLFASARSAGKKMSTSTGEVTIEEFTLEEVRAKLGQVRRGYEVCGGAGQEVQLRSQAPVGYFLVIFLTLGSASTRE